VVEGVVGVVLGLDLGEPPVRVIAVGLSNAADVVVGVKEVDVDAGAVGLEGVQEPPRPRGLGRGCSPDSSGSHTPSMLMLWATSRPA
jgi:hypothetical protein